MTKQLGHSDRGPAELDRARRNRGQAVEPEQYPKEGPLAAGDPGAPPIDEGEEVGPWSEEEAGEDETHAAGEAEAPPPQPGGSRHSESEKPAGPRSRWGEAPDED